MAPMAALEDQLPGRILVVGEFGDSIWDLNAARWSSQLSRPWVRHTLGLSPIEFRLRVGYHAFAPPCIAARHNQVIHALSNSEAMRPWSVGGSYDRPLPRRIAEEAGLPRDRFGTRKAASSHSHLTEPSRFSAKALNDYRHFVNERHAGIPSRIQDYWRARARWRHYAWDIKKRDHRRYVHPSFLERRFPFALIVRPNRVPWDYMFTFQWTVASVRSRYAMAAAVAR